MLSFTVRKLLTVVGTMLGIAVLTFVITNVAPGDPARLVAGPNATEDMVETIRSEYGLDQPMVTQFAIYMKDLVSGDLGTSIVSTRPVLDDLLRYAPATIELVLVAMTLGVIVGVPLGMLSAVYKDGPVDHFTRILSISGVAIPAFWLGILLQLYFSVDLGWLPVSGRLPLVTRPPEMITGSLLIDSLLAGNLKTFNTALSHMILPAVVLSFPCLASILRVNRAEMIEVLQSDFIVAARAHGISSRRIVVIYALKNALLPTLAMIGLRFGWMLGSTVLVETVFDWPGIGLYAVSSALASDFKPVIGVTLLIGFFFIIANTLVDLAYAWIDPRLRRA
ncbi:MULTISPECIES: ABC transporter permease [Pseudorhizobium]|uniref:Peptide ABC transporter n=1 Tax=Pseudorhizobium pelagicum TaxID=1509405 RepID=A0A922NZ46_9HYPH|nr:MULTISPECIES: ABC transporter permease [Pseudorhizobium]KEQ04750.1 peptide ABC transporter [Pseudorhizobium pelagicum]KEQ07351.1 peptide ABC transporter [Pseudorhizobium pelagicum]